MQRYKTLDEFLADQSPEKLEQINALRELILEAEPTLVENVKWNAPNYVYRGEDRLTLNLMNKQNAVKLVIHMGATIKENKTGEPVLINDEGIIEWNSNIRGTITFKDLEDIEMKKASTEKILKNWLAIDT